MSKERNSLKAGLFIVISIALIIAVIIGIKGAGRFLEPQQTCQVTFKLTDDVGGLREGDDVRVGGLRAGVVRDLDYISAADGKPMIVVSFSLPRRIELKQDARISIQTTVTGTSNLNIDNLGTGAPLAAGERLVGKPSGLSALLATAGEIAPEIKGVIADVRQTTLPKVNTAVDKAGDTMTTFKTTGENATELIKTIKSKIDPIVERYNAVADKGKEALGHIGDVFGESKADFKTTVANLAAGTGTVKEKLPGIMDKLDSGLAKAEKVIDGITDSLDDVKKTVANTREITDSVKGVINGNRSKIDGMIASLKTTGDNLKFASAEIRRSPWRLLYKPGPGEVANLNLFDSARQFAEGANDLNDASSALRDALKDPNISKEEIEKLVGKLDASFQKFTQVESELWKQVRE